MLGSRNDAKTDNSLGQYSTAHTQEESVRNRRRDGVTSPLDAL